MKNRKFFLVAVFAALTLACFQATALGQSAKDNFANLSSGGASVRWEVMVPNSGVSLTIAAPDGRSFTKNYEAGSSPEFSLSQLEGLPDGTYTYELRLRPTSSTTLKEAMKARGADDEPEAKRAARKRPAIPSLVQSGSFAILNGAIIVPGAVEGQRTMAKAAEQRREPVITFSNSLTRLRNHPMGRWVRPDDVIPDDLIVQGSACVGLDCVNGEVFGFDTVRLKENNTRLQFDDTSTSAGFPTNNWQIRANDSASGGGSFLGVVDQGSTGNSETGTIIGRFDAGAPANSFRVSSTGKVGLRTATPVLDLHINTSNTPAIRVEQNNTGGFTAQTWDIAGNEANFFVRDVTGGSTLPFRIRPGAPTSSVDINASGSVGVGTASPGFHFHVQGTGIQTIAVESTQNGNNAQFAFIGKTAGGVAQQWLLGENLATTAGAFEIFDSTAAQNRFFINTAGNVGLGTTAPDQKLSVQGDADKSAGGTSWGVFSDERLKDIKGSYSRGLSAVMGLRPVRFSYKKDNALQLQTDSENIGFSAQALQKVVPEAVTKSASGYLVVHSDPILWAMLNAIQEQQKEIAELKGQVRKLRAASRKHRK